MKNQDFLKVVAGTDMAPKTETKPVTAAKTPHQKLTPYDDDSYGGAIHPQSVFDAFERWCLKDSLKVSAESYRAYRRQTCAEQDLVKLPSVMNMDSYLHMRQASPEARMQDA